MTAQRITNPTSIGAFRLLVSSIVALVASGNALGWMNADQTLELNGFMDSTTHQRADAGLSKQRIRG